MEIKCAGCGNVFDDSLGFCPSCGRMVDKPTEPASFEEQTLDPTAQPAASQTDPQQNAYGADEQNTQASAQYQNQSYNYGSAGLSKLSAAQLSAAGLSKLSAAQLSAAAGLSKLSAALRRHRPKRKIKTRGGIAGNFPWRFGGT